MLAFVFVLGIIIFGSVRFLLKTNNQINFFLKKPKPNRTGSNLLVLVRFWFFRTKTGSDRFGSVFLVLTRFFRFGSVFFCLGSVWFGFFGFSETEPVGFFKILIGFFHSSVFQLFFSRFSRFNLFFDFFSHP